MRAKYFLKIKRLLMLAIRFLHSEEVFCEYLVLIKRGGEFMKTNVLTDLGGALFARSFLAESPGKGHSWYYFSRKSIAVDPRHHVDFTVAGGINFYD